MKRFIVLLISMIAACTVSAQVSTQNYICSRKMLNNTGSSHVDDISYFDGLGRPFQSVNKTVQNNVTKQRLATLLEYDYYGRETNMWLPTSVMADYVEVSTFRNTAVGSSGYNDSYPYSQSIYEASPLNRPLQQYGAGKLWHSNNRAVRTEYLVNASDSDRACKFYTVNGTSLSGGTEFYAANLLNVIKTTDEGNNVSYTFTDKLGRIVLTRQMNGTEAHDTYYVYNDKGNLCFVLQPMYQTTADIELYAFEYKYDGHGNCIWKKLPGAEYIEYVYDNYDRMTYSQDGNQRKNNRWMYYQYDAMGRPSGQGECTEKNRDSNPVQHIRSYYDGYYILSQSGFNNPDFPKGNTSYIKGRLAGSIISVPGSGSKIYIAYFYDIKGRVMQETRSNLLGGHDVTITTYTFTDKPATVTHIHTASGKNTWIEVYTYSYDHADRISKVQHTLGGTTITLYDATYDDLGRLKTKSLHGSTTNKLTYTYNLRGWLTGITGTRLTQNLYYNTGVGTAKYNGSISSMTWKAGNESTVRGYKFTYDGLDRLLNGTYGEGEQLNSNSGRYSENVTGYDKNGNITGLERYGRSGSSSYGMCDALTYTLNGNQMIRVDDQVSIGAGNDETDFKDAVKQANEYTYDANGNLTKDLNKGITGITYNCLNLPNAVTFSDGSTVTYIYSADGTKLRAVHKIGSVTTTTDYCDNVIYENNTAKLLLTGEGYISLSDKKYHYYLQDHQGNNRVVADKDGNVEETNHYYPFGGVFASSQNVQPYKYNGKELDTKKGLNWYDYGAREYDAVLGRFTTMDPMAEKYYAVSPYTYCVNNPIKFVDPTGMLTESPQTGSIRLSFWDKIKNAFNDLFSFTVDISSEEAKQKTAQKYNRQMSTLQSLNDGVEAVNTVMSIVNPVASVAELAANIQGENTKGIVLAGAMVALDVATGGKGKGAKETFKTLSELGLRNGARVTSNKALELGEQFLGKGYKEVVSGSGRYVSADGTRVFRMGTSDITGAHAGGSHVNFETLIPNPNKPGKMMVDKDLHIYLIE
ncbi:RHS repeat domain-containing protein [Bacteroides cellulosilyticus]|jgi:RHS repeat-associated protein|uniref:RHS repeat-associated core domain-containing protein n=5 Tax=Bacteroides cellulosilyticus TaxID=246787 RepID=I9QUL3_9BACE|nr:RHS repeat-associated core domain-containing protein [Bacteroides cellulosilyticus]EIY33208.1 RHS repeat-associated core domain-containing protein [Bacteroides cellulosilyticus CL02T12C19]KWR57461.1 RHS repeat protein [Bacteroides cellulosilyticus]